MEFSTQNAFQVIFPKYVELLQESTMMSDEGLESFIRDQLPQKVQLVRSIQPTFLAFQAQFTNLILKRPKQQNLLQSLILKASQKIEKYFSSLELSTDKQITKGSLTSELSFMNMQSIRTQFRQKLKQIRDLLKEKYFDNYQSQKTVQEEIGRRLYSLNEIYYFLKNDLTSVAGKFRIKEHEVLNEINKNGPSGNGGCEVRDLIYIDDKFVESIYEVIDKRYRPFTGKRDFFFSKIKQIEADSESKVPMNISLLVQSILGKEKYRVNKQITSSLTKQLRSIDESLQQQTQRQCKQIIAEVDLLKRQFSQVKNNLFYLDIIRGTFTEKYKMELNKLENVYYLSNIEKYLQDVQTFTEKLIRVEERIIDNRKGFMKNLAKEIEDKIASLITEYQIKNSSSSQNLWDIIDTEFDALKDALYGFIKNDKLQTKNTFQGASEIDLRRKKADEFQKRRIELQRAKQEKERQRRQELQEKALRQRIKRQQDKIKLQQRRRTEDQRIRRMRQERQQTERTRKIEQAQKDRFKQIQMEEKRKQMKIKQEQQRQRLREQVRRKQQEKRKKDAQDAKTREKLRAQKQLQDKRKAQESQNKKRQMDQVKKRRQQQQRIQEQRLKEQRQRTQQLKKQQQERQRRQRQGKMEREKQQRQRKQRQLRDKRQRQQQQRRNREERQRKERESKMENERRERQVREKEDRERKERLQREKRQNEQKERQKERERQKQRQKQRAVQLEREKKQKQDRQRKQRDDKQRRQKQQKQRRERQQKLGRQREQRQKRQREQKQRKEREQKQRKQKEQKQRRQRQQKQRRQREQRQLQEKKRKQLQEKKKKQLQEKQRKQKEQKQRVQREKKQQQELQLKQKKQRQQQQEKQRLQKQKINKEKQRKQKQEREKRQLQLLMEQQQKKKKAKPKAGVDRNKGKSSGINYDDLDDMLDDDIEAIEENESKLHKEKNRQETDQYGEDYEDDFESPQREDEQPQAGQLIEPKQLITIDTIKCLNDYMKGTSYSRKNKPNLQPFNNTDSYSYLFEELMYSKKLYIFNAAVSNAVLDFSKELLDQNAMEDDLKMSIQTIKEEMFNQYASKVGQETFSPKTMLILPFSFPNQQNIKVIEFLPAEGWFRTVLGKEPEDEESQQKLHSVLSGLLHIFDIQVEPTVQTMVIPEDSMSVLSTFDKQLPCLMLLYVLHYEIQRKSQPLLVNQYTVERFFYSVQILKPLYEAIQNNQEELVAFYEKESQKYSTEGNAIQILPIEISSAEPEYEEQLQQYALQAKKMFIQNKTVNTMLVLFQILIVGEEEEEDEQPQVEKITIYCSMERTTPKPTITYYIVSKDDFDKQNASTLFDIVSEGDDPFDVTVYMDFTRHNGLSQYSDWTLPLWARSMQKRKLTAPNAFRAITFSMTPYYVAYKEQD